MTVLLPRPAGMFFLRVECLPAGNMRKSMWMMKRLPRRGIRESGMAPFRSQQIGGKSKKQIGAPQISLSQTHLQVNSDCTLQKNKCLNKIVCSDSYMHGDSGMPYLDMPSCDPAMRLNI